MASFGALDWTFIVLTAIISAFIGIYHGRRANGGGSDRILTGGRRMNAIPVAISMLVTFLSATSLIGEPAEIYQSGIQLFWMQILMLGICIPISSFIFMKVLFELKVTSVYEYLEHRFNSPILRKTASLLNILQTLLVTSVTLYAPSLVLEAFVGWPIWTSVLGLGILGTAYTGFGGFKAVIWTDVFQFILIMIGILMVVIKGCISSGGLTNTFLIAEQHGRFQLFDWTFNLFQPYNTLNIFLGLLFHQVGFYGTNQAHVIRFCSVKNFSEAISTITWKAFLVATTKILTIFAGLSIFATYADCDPVKSGKIKTPDQILPYFSITELGEVPGMMGLFTSAIISAALSTISSSLNSLAALSYKDFLEKTRCFGSMSERQRGRAIVVISWIYGGLIIGLSFIVGQLGTIFRLLLVIVASLGGPLSATFMAGIFLPFTNWVGALTGMVMGSFLMGFLSLQSFMYKTTGQHLPTSTVGCSETVFGNVTVAVTEQLVYEWPQKIFTLSFLLYPVLGYLITISVIIAISAVARQFADFNAPDPKYLHYLVRKKSPVQTEEKETEQNLLEVR